MSDLGLTHEILETGDFLQQAEVIARLCPGFPFVELTPARYKSIFHQPEAKVLLTRRGGEVVDVGALILRRSRFAKTLVVTVASALQESDFFWRTVVGAAKGYGASELILEMFGEAAAEVRSFDHETVRHKTQIYVADLTKPDLAADLSSNHRRNLRKAEAAGFVVSTGDTAEAIENHVRLCGNSNERRAGRGEKIQGNKDRKSTEAYLASGCGTLYQAVCAGETLSSILVVRIGSSAYYDTGGTSPEGMKMGGSHFLMFSVMQILKSQGILSFSLDVANTEGLIKFKTGFGAREWPLQRVYIEYPSMIGRLRKLMGR
jgi:hypothetical protein